MRMMIRMMKRICRATRLQFTVTPTLTRPKVSSGADNGGGLDEGAHVDDDGDDGGGLDDGAHGADAS